MTYQNTNPFNVGIVDKFSELTDVQRETKLAAAAKFYLTEKHKSYGERAVIVLEASNLLHDRADEFARNMTLGMGTFGLGGPVFTKDIERCKRVASRTDIGTMFIDNISWSDAKLPFWRH